MDAMRTFFAGIVVEPQNECVNRKVGEGEITHRAIDSNGFGITSTPVVCTLVGVAGCLDRCPAVSVKRGIEQVHLHCAGLIGWGRVVCTLCHFNGDRGAAIGFASYSDRVAGNRHCGNAGAAGGGGDHPVTGPGHGDGGGRSAFVQGDAGLIQR